MKIKKQILYGKKNSWVDITASEEDIKNIKNQLDLRDADPNLTIVSNKEFICS
jgi:hypothetical protein